MPSLIIDCPSCGRKLRVPDALLGKAVKCPTCEHTFQSTTTQDSPAPPSVPSPAPDAAYPPPVASDESTAPFYGEEIEKDQEDSDRPWEESGHFRGRRDAEPHRGTLILVLGIVSIVMLVLCGPAGLPLGIAAWVMGRRDLIKMRQNLMDREGEGLTQAGWICGIIGTILDSLSLLCVLVYVGLVFTIIGSVRRGPLPPAPPAVPAPVRPVPAPGAPQPGNKAAVHYVPQRWQDYLPTAEG
jgi:predicted Zn finger-like uncharacterized protein